MVEAISRIKGAIREFYSLKWNLIVDSSGKEKEKGARSNEKKWCKPSMGWLKVNCDGAWDRKTKRARSGVIVRNTEGKVVDGRGKRRMADSVLIAEFFSLRDGIKLVVERKWQKVLLEIDAKGVAVRPLVLDIQRLLRLVPDWKLRVIKRANAAIDWVAIQTKLGMCLFDWIRHHPSSLMGFSIRMVC